MTLMFVLIVVTVMLMMIQRLVVRVPSDADSTEPDGNRDLVKLRIVIQLLVTVVGFAGGGYFLLYGHHSADVQLWAAGLIGSIFGFWLR